MVILVSRLFEKRETARSLVMYMYNLVPRAFPLKNGWGLFLLHPFFKGKALGTRLMNFQVKFVTHFKRKMI